MKTKTIPKIANLVRVFSEKKRRTTCLGWGIRFLQPFSEDYTTQIHDFESSIYSNQIAVRKVKPGSEGK